MDIHVDVLPRRMLPIGGICGGKVVLVGVAEKALFVQERPRPAARAHRAHHIRRRLVQALHAVGPGGVGEAHDDQPKVVLKNPAFANDDQPPCMMAAGGAVIHCEVVRAQAPVMLLQACNEGGIRVQRSIGIPLRAQACVVMMDFIA
jgi:hypothetical protein